MKIIETVEYNTFKGVVVLREYVEGMTCFRQFTTYRKQCNNLSDATMV